MSTRVGKQTVTIHHLICHAESKSAKYAEITNDEAGKKKRRQKREGAIACSVHEQTFVSIYSDSFERIQTI